MVMWHSLHLINLLVMLARVTMHLLLSRGVGSSLGKYLGGMGQDGTSTYKGDKDTMAASVPITRGSNNNSREMVKTVDSRG